MHADPAPPRARRRRRPDATALVLPLLACGGLGVLTALLGTGVHLARGRLPGGAAGLDPLVPWGVALALALVVATDLAVASLSLRPGHRPGPGGSLLAVAAGRGLLLGLLLLPTAEGDVVLTGLLASTVWIMLAVLLPAFAAPMASAVSASRRSRAGQPGRGAAAGAAVATAGSPS